MRTPMTNTKKEIYDRVFNNIVRSAKAAKTNLKAHYKTLSEIGFAALDREFKREDLSVRMRRVMLVKRYEAIIEETAKVYYGMCVTRSKLPQNRDRYEDLSIRYYELLDKASKLASIMNRPNTMSPADFVIFSLNRRYEMREMYPTQMVDWLATYGPLQ